MTLMWSLDADAMHKTRPKQRIFERFDISPSFDRWQLGPDAPAASGEREAESLQEKPARQGAIVQQNTVKSTSAMSIRRARGGVS